MKPELQNEEVMAMYDVRGIQNYIFKSNAAKEIVGASVLVEKIITEGLKEYVQSLEEKERVHYMTEWMTDDPEAFFKDSSVEMQIMFVGGGNAYALFRKGSVCQNVNRFLARYILERTYSLNLAVAVVLRTEDYHNDYEKINQEMRRIKAHMPLSMPVGAMPFMAADAATGYPLTVKEKDQYFSTESSLKRESFPKQEDEKIFDNMVTEKGDSSTLAVFHIDGNSMGNRIKTQMQDIRDYGEAVRRMRQISSEISTAFRTMVDKMKIYMDKVAPQIKKGTTYKLYREIIAAGDDITFVCNARLAIPAVDYFLSHIGDDGEFTACGGIAFFNSHFPFADAYQVAEACCESAKKRAKLNENRGEQDKVGNFLDFQICTNIRASALEDYRDRHYKNRDGRFVARPYYVPASVDCFGLNDRNDRYSIERLKGWAEYFCAMPRNKAKELRDVIPVGENEIKKEIAFLKSRGYQELEGNQEDKKIWYDALEIMDWYIKEL